MLVSETLPLRANLTVLENIATVPQFSHGMAYAEALDLAWSLLVRMQETECAYKRDPSLSPQERFIAKLLRAAVTRPLLLVLDRPALLLPDTHYPPFVHASLHRLDDLLTECWIVDYPWNEPLYAPR